MERKEMFEILERIARDEETNPTARVTALRALKEFPGPPAVDEVLCGGDVLPITGRDRANRRLTAEQWRRAPGDPLHASLAERSHPRRLPPNYHSGRVATWVDGG
jgi:hypothetical protein